MDYQELHTAVPSTNYQKTQFEAQLKELKPTTLSETLTGAGALSLDYLRTLLLQSAGTHAMTLANGSENGQEKEIFHVGTGGIFNLTGTFQDWTSLQFDTAARSAKLIWVSSKWVFVSGTARGN